ncbi:carboxypeptidase regulatory-like domain-containing protein [Patescibacteria group bacterium AH-259-L07]|nr:carboxypeptidase regulatory-like domain-containing protein [Patescibacteria group bacterium AH-259-L07]
MNKTKRICAMLLTLTIITWSMGPSLVYALEITSVTVTDTYIEAVFDGAVDTTTAGVPANYTFKTGPDSSSLVEQPLSSFDPYNMYTKFLESDTKVRIFNIDRLQLPSDHDTWEFDVDANTILAANTTSTYATPLGTIKTSTIGTTDAPVLDSITNSGGACNGFPCGKVGETLSISGSGYTTSTTAFFAGTSASTTFVGASQLTVAVPSGLTLGKVSVDLRNSDNLLESDSRPITVYDITFGVVVGTLTRSDGTTGVDQASVDVFLPGLPGVGGVIETHKNGKFAAGTTTAGTYEAQFTRPATETTEFAPPKHTNIAVTLDAVTNIGSKKFETSSSTTGTLVSGTVCKPKSESSTCQGVANADINVHTYDWTIEQGAISEADGTWEVFIGTTEFLTVTVDVEPSTFDRDVTGYRGVIDAKKLTLSDGTAVTGVEVFLATENVIGTVRTPIGTVSDSNPFPDTLAANVDVELHTTDWTYSTFGQTDSSGKFSFGGVPAGTNYVLEVRPPYSGNFSAYAQTTITGLTVASSGVTDFGTLRFAEPNVFGRVLSGTDPVFDAWVNLFSETQWFGTATRSDGKFSFGGVEKGFYRLEVFPPATGTGAGSASYQAEVEITSTTSNNLGDIAFTAPNVVGHVYGPTGTTGQANMWVDLCPFGTFGQCYSGGTDSTGKFGIGTVPDGTWGLNIWVEFGAVFVAPKEQVLVVSSGAPTTLDGVAISDPNDVIIRLVDASVNGLKGQVCGPSDTSSCENPQSNVGVNLRVANADFGFQWSQTDASGNFAFGNVNAGSYDIEVDPWGKSGVSRSTYTITVNSDDTVTVGSNTYQNRTITLFLSSPNITGTLYTPEFAAAHTSSSNPTPDTAVANSWLNLHKEGPLTGPGGWYGTNTDGSGAFSFGGVKPGSNYVLEVEPSWGSAYTGARFTGITFTDTDSDGTADECNVGSTDDGNPTNGSCDLDTLLGAGATKRVRVGIPNMRGQIVDPNGTAVRDAWVMVHDQFWFNQAGGNTDRNGFFNLGGLVDGTYQIEINLGWGASQAYIQPSGLTVEITNDIATIKLNGVALVNNKITLTEPAKTLTGKVYKDVDGSGTFNAGDTVVTDARVEAHRDLGGGFFETRVDTNGDYTLKLSGGSWWVEVWPDWGFTQPDWLYDKPPTRITFNKDSTSESKTKDFIVASANSTITGVVKTPGGQAVSNVWVDVHSGAGAGNGESTNNNGRFSIQVSAGTYEVMVFPETADYGSADPVTAKVADSQTTDVGTIFLKSRNSTISGTVTDSNGNVVSNVMVEAWQFDGAGWTMDFTAANTGQYSLTVSEGKWGVMVLPMSDGYVYQGAPREVSIDENETLASQDFVLKTSDTTLKIKVVDLSGTRVTDIFGGVWVRDTALGDIIDFGGVMEDRMEKEGLMEDGVFAAGVAGTAGMEMGGFSGGVLVNGYTTLKVPGGSTTSPTTYEIGLHTPPGTLYTLQQTESVNVVSGVDQDVELIARTNDSTITGHLYVDANSNGVYDATEELTGVQAFIHLGLALELEWKSHHQRCLPDHQLNHLA